MAAKLQLSRDTEVFASVTDTSGERYYWKLPILDGFSFTQSTATTEVSISEMADLSGTSRRGRKIFTDAFEPAEWNMQLYARPHQIASGNIAHSTDELLWANFVNAGAYTHSNRTWANAVTKTAGAASPSTLTVDFDDSNVSALGTFDLYFVLGACGTAPADFDASPTGSQTIYKIAGAVCNSVSMEFDIDGILTLDWSGMGSLITQEASMPPAVISTNWYDNIIEDGIAHSNNNFIRNRLSTLEITGPNPATGLPYSFLSYELTLTGGNITFENNLTYLTPEELCVVNQPLGNVTGVRNVSGSFSCYLNAGETATPLTVGTSGDLFDDLASAVAVVNNSTNLLFSIGGASTPKLEVNIPTAHLEIPSHQIEDIISLEMNFHALPSTINNTDEATIIYHNA